MINKIKLMLVLNIFMLSCSNTNNPVSPILERSENYIINSLNVVGSMETLDIITWNIEYFPKHKLTLEYVHEAIDSLNVDIIALQEITSTEKLNDLNNFLGDNWISFRSGAINSTWGQLSYLINTNSINLIQNPYTILDW